MLLCKGKGFFIDSSRILFQFIVRSEGARHKKEPNPNRNVGNNISNLHEIKVAVPKNDRTDHKTPSLTVVGITSGAINTTSSNSFLQGGTVRWMSPELFDPEAFDLKDGRRTTRSDCYALGMVIYEVLSRRVPFPRDPYYAIVVKVLKGAHPERPGGEERTWFTDDIWSLLQCCWKPNPGDRPNVEDVLECLEKVSRVWALPFPRTTASLRTADSSGWDSDQGNEGRTDESEVSSPSQATSSRPPQSPPQKGDPSENSICPFAHEFSALLCGTPDHRDLEANAVDPSRSGLGGSRGIPDEVSWVCVVGDFWY